MKLEIKQTIYFAVMLLITMTGISMLLWNSEVVYDQKTELWFAKILLLKVAGGVFLYLGRRIYVKHFKKNY